MSHRLLRALLPALLAAAAAGCSTTRDSSEFVRAEWLHDSLYEQPDRRPYRILPGDELEVRFFHTPEFDVTLPVLADGVVSLPLGRSFLAAGMTPEEMSSHLESLYEGELLDPEIAVIVLSSAGHFVHVGGEIAEPGVVEMAGPMKVLDALLRAGGVMDTADTKSVLVLRQISPEESELLAGAAPFGPEARDHMIVQVDLDALLARGDHRQNIALLPSDVIVVPKSGIADMNTFVDLYIRRNLPFDVTVGYRVRE